MGGSPGLEGVDMLGEQQQKRRGVGPGEQCVFCDCFGTSSAFELFLVDLQND